MWPPSKEFGKPETPHVSLILGSHHELVREPWLCWRPRSCSTGRHRLPDGVGVEKGDALCMLTSGSTAEPKVAILTMDAVTASALASQKALGVDSSQHRWLCCLPCAHIGGLSVITRSLLTGTPVDVLPRPEPSAVRDAAARGATHVSLVATALQRIDPSLFRTVLLGGAAPPRSLGANVIPTYGMTDTGSGVVYDGTALEGVEIAIEKPDGEGLGEILVAGPMLLRSYRSTRAPFVSGPDNTGRWLATGDIGRLAADGRLEVRGRQGEIIVTGGEKVFPPDVEAVLAPLDGIKEVAVWRRDDPEWGQRVVAWIVPDGDAPSLEHIKTVVTDELAPYCAPKELVVVSELPRTPSGKIRRRELI